MGNVCCPLVLQGTRTITETFLTEKMIIQICYQIKPNQINIDLLLDNDIIQ